MNKNRVRENIRGELFMNNLHFKKVIRRKLAADTWFAFTYVCWGNNVTVLEHLVDEFITKHIIDWYKYICGFTNRLVEEIEKEKAKKKCSCVKINYLPECSYINTSEI